MGGKESGRKGAYPGANLAKGWIENDERVVAKTAADRALFTLLSDAVSNWARLYLFHVVGELCRKWTARATLEEVLALIIYFKEYKP